MRRTIYTILSVSITVFIFMAGAAFAAEDGTIQGSVNDTQTGEALPGANVLVVGTSLGAATDLNGRFVIRNVPPGSYTLRTTYVGYNENQTNIMVRSGEEVRVELKLQAVGVQGKEVVVTAQASGQNSAINQQLSSMKITNVVSAAKIQELPDANAAESVGRLPGVSLVREGGEGAQIVIRGLSPQYNQVEIDGVQMAGNVSPNNPGSLSSGFGDRAVDLSMISSNMLGGIEVTKAITPDMDAAVLGGVVNFSLREAQTSEPQFHLLAQGGYDGLQGKYDDYKFAASGEKRFFSDRFGVFAEADVERINLTSNVLGASYALNSPKFGMKNPTYLTNLNLTDVPRERQRYNATVVMDYRLNEGKIDFMNFVSSGTTNQQQRSESFDLSNNNHNYNATDSKSILNVMTNLIDFQKTISIFNIDAKVSHSYSEDHIPDLYSFGFMQAGAGLSNHGYQSLNPQQIPPLANDSLDITYLYGISSASSISKQRDLTGQLDVKTDFNLSDLITGTVKAGGQYTTTTRSYTYTQGDGNLYYSGLSVARALVQAFPWMASTINSKGLILPLFEDPNFKYGKFLDGEYALGPPLNLGLLEQVVSVAKQYGTLESWSPNSQASIQNNYNGDEYRSAGYGMVTINIGPNFTLLPGVRYQNLTTRYTAPRGILTSSARYSYQYRDTTTEESHGFWLPMVHLKYNPFPWFQIHLAYTNTLAYPDFSAITPEMQVGTSSVDWHNYLLKPARSSNYDVVLSLYDNTVGLFTVDGFLKHINDLIFGSTTYIMDPSLYPGVPSGTVGYGITTMVNNPYPVDVLGIELDWQTHFWYLPGPMSGLVLNVNFTHIFSQAKYPLSKLNVIRQYPYEAQVVDTFYTSRLINQPNDIANLAVGYDYKGFSVRVSMLYQANVFEAANFWPELRANTAAYLRWDLAVNQRLPWEGLQLFFDLNNINSARDVQLNQGSSFPTAEEHYGMTADLGLRWQL